MPRSTVYRRRIPKPPRAFGPRRRPARSLTQAQRQAVLDVLRSKRFIDLPPEQVFATLLEEKTYLCSVRTMYRLLRQQGETTPRRRQRQHPAYHRPELMADAPNQTWTWDITLLRGPHPGVYYRLYVILDLFSRYVVGWLLAHHENGKLAARVLREACEREGVEQAQLTIHADRGAAATSKTVADMLAALGVRRSFSRPRVSDDNPFSESLFKHAKYSPTFPNRFTAFNDARAFCQRFFPWYNDHHHHSGLAFFTPSAVHHGLVEQIAATRSLVLADAFSRHPERFVHGPPAPRMPPAVVYINPPLEPIASEIKAH